MWLSGWIDQRVDALSKGMAQNVQFISSVLSQPEVLILDEPFNGLDPVNAEVLKDAVVDPRRAGTTVVFSTHDMSVAERLCDRFFMIFKGRKVLDGMIDEIQSIHGYDTIWVRTEEGAQVLDDLDGVLDVNDRCGWSPPPSSARRSAPRSFIISILLLPAIMGASALLQIVVAERADTKPREFAVLDRTGVLLPAIIKAAEAHNAQLPDSRAKNARPRMEQEAVPSPEAGQLAPAREAGPSLAVGLSDRVRRGELDAYIEIPAGLIEAGRQVTRRRLPLQQPE